MNSAELSRKLLYPSVFLGALPLYALLFFALQLPFAVAVIGTVVSATLLLMALEMRAGIFTGNRRAKRRRALDVYYIAMGVAVSTLLAETYILLGSWIGSSIAPVHWLHTTSWLAEWLVAIVIMDFCAYWVHRLQHRSERSLLWRAHSVHHALPILDVVAGAQVHLLDGMISASPLLLIAAMGFSPAACGAAFVMNLVSAGLHHTGLRGDPDWFNFVTVAPQAHRWHHADFSARTVNFGFVLALWDMLFGTFSFPPRQQPACYGARSLETFPDSLAGHVLVGTTGAAYRRLVKIGAAAR